MVFWSKPHEDMGEHRPKEQLDLIPKIGKMEKTKSLVTSLEAVEESMKGSPGSLSYVDGSVYKTPTLLISKSQPPTKKTKTEGKENAKPQGVLKLNEYPPSDHKLSELRRYAVKDSSSAASSSKSKSNSSSIPGECLSMSEADMDEWIGKGMKSSKAKIIKSLLSESGVDAKHIEMELHRVQIVENGGMSWRSERSTSASSNHLATIIVVLPVKVLFRTRFVEHFLSSVMRQQINALQESLEEGDP